MCILSTYSPKPPQPLWINYNILYSFYHHHWPSHSASCLSASAVFAPVAEGDTTTCAGGLSALVAEWKSTTRASCNWWQPPPVQLENLHQLKKGKHHKHKAQRSGHKVQRSGPASVLVSTGCSNNMQLQPPLPVQGVFALMAEGKMPPAQVASSDHHHVCNWSTCIGW